MQPLKWFLDICLRGHTRSVLVFMRIDIPVFACLYFLGSWGGFSTHEADRIGICNIGVDADFIVLTNTSWAKRC